MRKRFTLLAAWLAAGAAVMPAAPPEHARWRLTFSDEFDGTALDGRVWEVESGSPTHILSSRWPENIEVKDGVCRLVTRKENRGGKEWTTAHMWTRTFRQKYGYFEARYRYGRATGLNNAFWLMPRATNEQAGIYGMKGYLKKFEIDINEGHYPDKVNMNIHNWEGEHWSQHQAWVSSDDLSQNFHVYGLEWTDNQLIWYVDGVERRRYTHEICHMEAPVILSTAVLKWAGPITDALDGAAMEVDYVRVYERTGPNPAAPSQRAAILARLPGSPPPPGYVLRWSDEFNGAKVDLGKWQYRTGPRLESFNRPENVSVRGGKVRIFLDGRLNCVLDYPHTRHRHDPLNFWLTSVAHVKRAGEVDDSALPGRMYVDHAAVYEKDLYMDDGDPGYYEQGEWKAVAGGYSFSSAREACAPAASASWRPDFLVADNYRVLLYRVPPSGAEGEAAVTINAAGEPARTTVRFRKEPAAWVDLGVHRFEVAHNQGVSIAPAAGCVVADMVKFVRRPSSAQTVQ